jgi:hypothetical protein
MDTKTKGIVATIAAVIFCGCPGLFMCFFGVTGVFASMMPGADIDVMGSSDPSAGIAMGLVSLCLSFIFIAIPIAVGFFMLRKKPEDVVSNEPLPPAA